MGLADMLGETMDGPGAAPKIGNTGFGDQFMGTGYEASQKGAADISKYNTGPYATTDQDQQQYQQQYSNAREAAGQQQNALSLLASAAQGNQPSVAQLQQQQGLNNAIQSQMAMANSSRGGATNMAAAQRNAAMQGASMQQAGVNQAAQLRAQEMAQAQQAYMQGAGALRGQDLQQAGTSLQSMGMSENMALQQAQLQAQQNQINNQQQLGMYGLAAGASTAQLGADTSNQALAQQARQFNAQQNTAAINGAIGAAGSLAMMSDERLKEDVRPAGDADRFLASLHPATYRYKDPSNEPSSRPTGGRYLGIMAQDVERSPTGRTIVKDTPRGKALEGGSLMSALAAGVGRLHERLSDLEGRR